MSASSQGGSSQSGDSPRPLTVIIWVLVIAVLMIGGWKLFHLHDRSADQKILINKSHG